MGYQPDAVVEKYMSQAKAFIYAAVEDFGIALVEAQACGTPVIAYGAGGALETIQDFRQSPEAATGLLFDSPTETGLIEAVKIFEAEGKKFHPEFARSHAANFAPKIFESRYLAFLEECHLEFTAGNSKKNLAFWA